MIGGEVVESALALGVAYAIVGAAVAVVGAATRNLFMSVGAIASVGLTAALTLGATEATGISGPLGLLLAVGAAAGVGALLGPVVIARRTDVDWLVGFVVAAGVLEAVAARTFGGRTLRPDPLVELGNLDPVWIALLLGLPATGMLTWALVGTRWGRRVRVVGASPAAAEAAGMHVLGLRSAALAVASAGAVLAAALVAPVVSIGPAQSGGLTVRGVAAALLLGNRNPMWAVPAGLTLGLSEALGQRWWPQAGAEVAIAIVVLGVLAIRGPEAARGWGRAW